MMNDWTPGVGRRASLVWDLCEATQSCKAGPWLQTVTRAVWIGVHLNQSLARSCLGLSSRPFFPRQDRSQTSTSLDMSSPTPNFVDQTLGKYVIVDKLKAKLELKCGKGNFVIVVCGSGRLLCPMRNKW